MKPKFWFLFLVLLTASSCNNPAQPVGYNQGEDYEIYSIVLKEEFGSSSTLVIMRDSTTISASSCDSGIAAHFKESLPALQDETITDFLSANHNPLKLMPEMNIDNLVMNFDYDLGAGEETVHVSLSRVGYDSSRTQAIVEVGELRAPLAGAGCLFLITKQNGIWRITGRCMTWIA